MGEWGSGVVEGIQEFTAIRYHRYVTISFIGFFLFEDTFRMSYGKTN